MIYVYSLRRLTQGIDELLKTWTNCHAEMHCTSANEATTKLGGGDFACFTGNLGYCVNCTSA